jgi:hypothetical protein
MLTSVPPAAVNSSLSPLKRVEKRNFVGGHREANVDSSEQASGQVAEHLANHALRIAARCDVASLLVGINNVLAAEAVSLREKGDDQASCWLTSLQSCVLDTMERITGGDAG